MSRSVRCAISLAVGCGLMLLLSGAAVAQYQLVNLTSNQVGWARHVDPLLVNGWGLVHGPGSPWWLSAAGSGWSTLYDGGGNVITQLRVVVPTAGNGPSSPKGLNGPGSPTGIVFNGTNEFQVKGGAAAFLFATLDGTISGWAPGVNFNEAILAVDNSSKKAVYTGLAITNRASGNLLYAADFANNKVDVYNASFKWVMSFTDKTLPAGFAPFGIQDINGLVYVAFASTSGGAGGFIDQFTEDGELINGKPLIQGAPLHNPWGIVAAPSNFGPLSNTLLISNETPHGTINAFDGTTGKFVGVVKDMNGKPIQIDQLWGISFGDGSAANGAANHLYFAAGPHGYQTGTFGVIEFKP